MVGSNGKIYWSGKFYGNQYVTTQAISNISRSVANGRGILGAGISIAQIGYSWYNEGYWGPQTQAVAASAVGGMAGSAGGAMIGAWIGAHFGGIGAIPGAVIGGFIGGFGGGIGGSLATEKAFQHYKSR